MWIWHPCILDLATLYSYNIPTTTTVHKILWAHHSPCYLELFVPGRESLTTTSVQNLDQQLTFNFRMFESVKSAIGGSGVTLEDGGVILISETASTSANGLVTHFLSYGVTNGHPVCFVTLQHTWGHYCNIGNKLGLNFRQQIDQGNIKVVEGLKLMAEVLDGSKSDIGHHPFDFILNTTENPLKNLYKLIKKSIEPWKENGQYFLIIIENITSLLNLGIQAGDINIFSQYCKALVGGSNNTKSGSLIIVTTHDERDEGACLVTKTIAHSAIIYMSLQGLSTGISRDVHGDLKITSFNRHSPFQCLPSIHHFQFKMEDKNMKLFAPGTSANVL
nr:elongator complex protein 6-like isoform X1 [Procambarus clarkii]